MVPSSELILELAKPQWFLPLSVALWLAVSAVLARAGGWRSLGQQFAATAPPQGQSFRFTSGSSGSVHWPVRYRSCLHVVVSDAGLYVAVMFPFSFQSPALLLPWSAVDSVSERQLFTDRRVTFRWRNHWSAIVLSGPVGQLAKAAHERSSASQ
jgi:hypothetical protein